MTDFSRRDLLKFFGIGAGTLLVPPIVTKAATTLVFGNFDSWLQSTSKAIREKKLVSFQITIDKQQLRIKGNTDDFISGYLSNKAAQKEADLLAKNRSRYEGHKNSPKENEPTTVRHKAVFTIESKTLPDRFVETIKTKHGRMNFVKMCSDNTLNTMKDLETYLEICQKARTKELKERHVPRGWAGREPGDPECTCYKSTEHDPNCPYHKKIHLANIQKKN